MYTRLRRTRKGPAWPGRERRTGCRVAALQLGSCNRGSCRFDRLRRSGSQARKCSARSRHTWVRLLDTTSCLYKCRWNRCRSSCRGQRRRSSRRWLACPQDTSRTANAQQCLRTCTSRRVRSCRGRLHPRAGRGHSVQLQVPALSALASPAAPPLPELVLAPHKQAPFGERQTCPRMEQVPTGSAGQGAGLPRRGWLPSPPFAPLLVSPPPPSLGWSGVPPACVAPALRPVVPPVSPVVPPVGPDVSPVVVDPPPPFGVLPAAPAVTALAPAQASPSQSFGVERSLKLPTSWHPATTLSNAMGKRPGLRRTRPRMSRGLHLLEERVHHLAVARAFEFGGTRLDTARSGTAGLDASSDHG
jgi:hypothetical protein